MEGVQIKNKQFKDLKAALPKEVAGHLSGAAKEYTRGDVLRIVEE